MFIRRTRTRADGEYFTFRLVRSERIGNKVRQRTLLNLGRHFDVAQSQWPMLCRRIDELLAGQMPLSSDVPPALETHAQRITAALLAGDRIGTASPPTDRGPDLQHVDVDSLELLRPRSVGVEHVGLWAVEKLALPDLFERLGIGPSLRTAAVGSIVARMARPGSERATRRWLGERSALGELLGADFETMGPMRLHRASDALMAHREAIERHLFDRAMGLFGLQRTVTLYDLTNTYFEGGAGRQPKARRGHSKDKRTDRPLLTLGLVLDAGGFVCRSQVFAGNVCEHRTLAEMLDALDAPRGALVVMDRGIATEERVCWLREQGYRYLVVGREHARHFDAEHSVCIRTAANRNVHLRKVVSDDGREAHHRRTLRRALQAGPHRTLRGACQTPRPETGRPGPGTHRAARAPKPGARPTLRHHRHRPPVRTGDRSQRRLGRPPPSPQRPATRHHHLPTRRRTHPARAQGDTARSVPNRHLRPPRGIDHASGGTRRTVVRTDPKRTDVVPLDGPGYRNVMICIYIMIDSKDGPRVRRAAIRPQGVRYPRQG